MLLREVETDLLTHTVKGWFYRKVREGLAKNAKVLKVEIKKMYSITSDEIDAEGV
jgi:hypothetical protein